MLVLPTVGAPAVLLAALFYIWARAVLRVGRPLLVPHGRPIVGLVGARTLRIGRRAGKLYEDTARLRLLYVPSGGPLAALWKRDAARDASSGIPAPLLC